MQILDLQNKNILENIQWIKIMMYTHFQITQKQEKKMVIILTTGIYKNQQQRFRNLKINIKNHKVVQQGNSDLQQMPVNKESNNMYKSLIRDNNKKGSIDNKKILQILVKDKQKDIFTLLIKPYEIQIERSLQDIIWLRDYLNVEFPFYFLPPIESQSNKIQFVQNFMNRICDREYIQHSKVLENFIIDEKFQKIDEKQMPFLNDFMLNKINTVFSINENKQKLQNQEQFYDQYFTAVMGQYNEYKNEIKYYQNLFQLFSKQANINEIQYEKLQNLSQNLSTVFKNAGSIIHQISHLLQMIQDTNNKNHQNLQFAQEKEVNFTEYKLIVGMEHWGNQMMSQSYYINQNMTEYFRYRKHEENQLKVLLDQRIDNISETIQRMNQIDQKKRKLWQSKEINNWQMNQELDDYYECLADFEQASKYILPDETYVMNQIEKQNLFINKHVLYEFLNYIQNTNFYVNQNFVNFNLKIKKDFQSEDVLWNIFSKDNKGILKKDYTINLIKGNQYIY